MKVTEPLVILIDLDGTIQGNVCPQVWEYETIGIISGVMKEKVQYKDALLSHDLDKGLLRPQFAEALIDIKRKHPNVEFFVYTASSDEWANFLVPKIIKHCFGSKNIINLPLFTRKHCMSNGKKRIANVKPEIVSSLNKKYPRAVFSNIFLVDNNPVLYGRESDKLILCPTYDKTILLCPIRMIPKYVLTRDYKFIEKVLFGTQTSKDLQEFLATYYTKMLKKFIEITKHNASYSKDNYWIQFRNIMLTKKHIVNHQDVDFVVKKLKNISYKPLI